MDLKLFFQYFYSQIGEEILANLELKDILALREVNKSLNQALEDPNLWLRLCLLKCQLMKVPFENSSELLEWRELVQKSINPISRKKVTHLLQRQFLAISQFGTQKSDIVQDCGFKCYRCNKVLPFQSPLYFAFVSKDEEMCEKLLTKRLKNHGGKVEAVEGFLNTYFKFFDLEVKCGEFSMKCLPVPDGVDDFQDEFESMMKLTVDYMRHSKTFFTSFQKIYHFCYIMKRALKFWRCQTLDLLTFKEPSDLVFIPTTNKGTKRPATIDHEDQFHEKIKRLTLTSSQSDRRGPQLKEMCCETGQCQIKFWAK